MRISASRLLPPCRTCVNLLPGKPLAEHYAEREKPCRTCKMRVGAGSASRIMPGSALFIDARHQGSVGRVAVKPDDVAHPGSDPGQALSANSGSVDCLNVSTRCGCSLKARQVYPRSWSRCRCAAPCCGRTSAWLRPELQRLYDDILDLGVVDDGVNGHCSRHRRAIRRVRQQTPGERRPYIG